MMYCISYYDVSKFWYFALAICHDLNLPGRGALLLPRGGEGLAGGRVHPRVHGCPADLQWSLRNYPSRQ